MESTIFLRLIDIDMQAFAVGTGLMSSPHVDKWCPAGQRSQPDLMMLSANGALVPVCLREQLKNVCLKAKARIWP